MYDNWKIQIISSVEICRFMPTDHPDSSSFCTACSRHGFHISLFVFSINKSNKETVILKCTNVWFSYIWSMLCALVSDNTVALMFLVFSLSLKLHSAFIAYKFNVNNFVTVDMHNISKLNVHSNAITLNFKEVTSRFLVKTMDVLHL